MLLVYVARAARRAALALQCKKYDFFKLYVAIDYRAGS